MTYAEAIHFLYDLRLFGLKLGLENTRQLAALVGNPQDRLRFIHVAGTNGKGSTCAMLESIYRAAGLRVGLFTSPHLVSFRERIQVNRQLISEADVARLVTELRGRIHSATPGAPLTATPAYGPDFCPTFFEFVTVMALCYFAEQQCDLVVWETGMGGRLDATNIVTPLASVITNVQFDHQQWLGDTLAKIAVEKAGIIKPGVPVVTATDEPEALAVIEQTAKRLDAPLFKVEHAFGRLGRPDVRPSHQAEAERLSLFAGNLPDVSTGPVAARLLGAHQRINAALAVATVRTLADRIPVSDAALRAGLERAEWPGRLQLITRGTRTFVLDGAHNVAGARALREALRHLFPGRRPALIFGVLADKDWTHICEVLAPLAEKIFTTRVASLRSAATKELAEGCRRAHPHAEVVACDSLQEALQRAVGESFVVITGSLYLVGEALERLEVLPPGVRSERELNEWVPSR